MNEDEFINAIMERTGAAGFDTQYSKKYQAPELKKRASDVLGKQANIASKDRPAKRERKSRSESVRLTSEEQAFKEYDDARQKLIDFFSSSLNTPKGMDDKDKVITDIVNQVSRERREAGYKTPAAAPAESPTPAAEPEPKVIEAAAPPQAAPAPERAEMIPMMEEKSEVISSAGERRTEPEPQQSRRERRDERLERKFDREGVSTLSDMAGGAEFTPVADTETPAAFTEEIEKPTVSEDRMMSLFKTSTGTRFNPKSKADAGRMAQLRSFVESNPDVLNKSDVGASLAFYRTLK